MSTEKWHIINEAGTKRTIYFVSNHARVKWHNVKTGKEGIIKPDYAYQRKKDARHPNGGYVYVCLCVGTHKHRQGFFLHRLVATYFCQKRDIFCTQVDHLDNDHLNNLPENLEWVTASENMKRAAALKKLNKSLQLC